MEKEDKLKMTKEKSLKLIYERFFFCLKNNEPMSQYELTMITNILNTLIHKT